MPTLTEEQLKTLKILLQRDPNLHYEVHGKHRFLCSISGILSDTIIGTPEAAAKNFLKTNRNLFGMQDVDEELRAPVLKTDNAGWTHVTFHQSHKGIQVWSGRVTAHLNPEKKVHSVTNAYRPDLPTAVTPTIHESEAIKIARKHGAHTKDDRLTRDPQLVILPDDTPALAWVFALTGKQSSYLDGSSFPGVWLYFIDAIRGTVIRRTPLIKEGAITSTGLSVNNPGRLAQQTRTGLQTWHDDSTGRDQLRDTITGVADGVEIITYKNLGNELSWDDDPAPLGNNNWSRTTGETSTAYGQRALYQPAEVDAHYFGGELYRFWRRAPFNRNSIDNQGCDIELKPHWSSTSARWDGTHILLGDGDLVSFTFKSGQLDVFGHESTHGVSQAEIPPDGMIGWGQSGHAEESFCDIFGCFAERNWLFEELVAVQPHSCLRNPSNPSDPNAVSHGPDHFGDYDYGQGGEPHANCHILDHACYLMTYGDVHHRAGRVPADIPVYPGIDWDKAETIYYRAITDGFTEDPGLGTDAEPYFAKVRTEVLRACEQIYGHNSCEYKTARLAFYAVGLHPAGEAYGPDVMVTPWGDTTHHDAAWQSPDFYVLDAANNPAEPLRGQHNRLFVRVRNIGDELAENVQVRALYAPFSATYRHEHFKEIATSIPFALNSGEERAVEVDWDMTNLDENNSGRWPPVNGATGIRGYDHFCVRAEVIFPNDVNTCNNTAQNNFVDVALNPGDEYDTSFIIPCPTEEESSGELDLVTHLPDSWKVAVKGVSLKEPLRLYPKKPIVARLQVTASPKAELEPPIDGDVSGRFRVSGIRIAKRITQLLGQGAFTGTLIVETYDHTRRTFSGLLNGRLVRARHRFTTRVRGEVRDPLAMSILGKAEGFLLGNHWKEHKPFKAEFEGKLKPKREVSVSLNVKGLEPSGVTLGFHRK